ncbi:MAG: hypothetical protein ACRENE_22150 [Polyangiaceae bacterium]
MSQAASSRARGQAGEKLFPLLERLERSVYAGPSEPLQDGAQARVE